MPPWAQDRVTGQCAIPSSDPECRVWQCGCSLAILCRQRRAVRGGDVLSSSQVVPCGYWILGVDS